MSNLDINNNISVQISGNPQGNSGFESLWSYGNHNPAYVTDVTYPGVSTNHHFFVVKITNSGVAYKMHLCNITSSGSGRPGALILGIFIPRNFQLKGGHSPFKLLEDLFEQLKSQALIEYPVGEGKVVYQFKERSQTDYSLKELVQAQSLEPRKSQKWVIMQGKAKAYQQISDKNLSTFAKDLMFYDGLSSYSELVIAEEIVGPTLLGLNIPRKKEYLIKVNGIEKGIVSDIDQEVTLSSNSPSEKYYDPDMVSFKIRDLLEGKNPSPYKIDLAEIDDEIINVTLHSTPKKETYYVVYDGPNKEEINPKNTPIIKIFNKPVSINPQNLSFSLEGEYIGGIKSAEVSIHSSTHKYKSYEIKDDKFIIHLLPIPNEKLKSNVVNRNDRSQNSPIQSQVNNRDFGPNMNKDPEKKTTPNAENGAKKESKESKQKKVMKLLLLVSIVSLLVGIALGVGGTRVFDRIFKNSTPTNIVQQGNETGESETGENETGENKTEGTATEGTTTEGTTTGGTTTGGTNSNVAQEHLNNMSENDINLGELEDMATWYKDLSSEDKDNVGSRHQEVFQLYSELYNLMKKTDAKQDEFQAWLEKAKKKKVKESARIKVARIYTDGSNTKGKHVHISPIRFMKRRDKVRSSWKREYSLQSINNMLQKDSDTKVIEYD